MKIENTKALFLKICFAAAALAGAGTALGGCVRVSHGTPTGKARVQGVQTVPKTRKIITDESIAIRADLSDPIVRKLEPYLPLVADTYTNSEARWLLSVSTDAFGQIRIRIYDTLARGNAIDILHNKSDISPKSLSAEIRQRIQKRMNTEFVSQIASADKKLYVGSNDTFGIAFIEAMREKGWKCFPVRDYSDIPSRAERRQTKFLVKFSGRRDLYGSAKSVAAIIIDLDSGEEIFRVTRGEISAQEFAYQLTNLFAPDAAGTPAESSASKKSSASRVEK